MFEQRATHRSSGNEQQEYCYPEATTITLGDLAIVFATLGLLDIRKGGLKLCTSGRGLVLWKIADLTHGDSNVRMRLGRFERMMK